jgi:transposase
MMSAETIAALEARGLLYILGERTDKLVRDVVLGDAAPFSDLDPLTAMLRYKQLWRVEQTFGTAKHLLATRPIFHKLDETIHGHVFCSFLG